MSDKELGIQITADSKKAVSGINEATSALNKLTKKISNSDISQFATSIGGISKGFSAMKNVISTVASAIGDLSEASLVQQRAEITLSTAIKNNPYYDNSATQRLKAYASQLQATSTIGDETLLPLMSNLVSYGRSEAEVMDIMQTAVDMAESGVMSLDSAVSALNATFQGNVGTLGRQIPALKNLSAEQLKAGEGVKLLKEQYAGAAEEISNSVGAIQKMKNSWGDLKEHIGNGINTLLTPLAKGFGFIVDGLNVAIGGFVKSRKNVDKIKEILEEIPEINTDNAGKNGFVEDESKKQLDAYEEKVNKLRTAYKTINTDYEKAKNNVDSINRKIELWYNDPSNRTIKGQEQLQELRAELEKAEKELDEYQEIYDGWLLDEGRIGNSSSGPLAQAEKDYRAQVEKIKQENATAIAKLEEDYDKLIADTQTEIANRKKAGETITAEAEAQELLNKGQEFYVKKLNEGYLENEKIKKSLEGFSSTVDTERTVAQREAAIKAYKAQYEETQKEITSKRALGEEITREEEATQLLNVATQGYVNMLKTGLSTEAPEVKLAAEKIKALSAEVAGYNNLATTYGDVKKQADEYIKAHKEIKEMGLSEIIGETITTLEAEAEKVKDNTDLYNAYIAKIKELKALQGDVQTLESDDRIENFKDAYGEESSDRQKTLEALKKLEVSYSQMTADEKAQVEEDYALRHRQLVAELVEKDISMVASYIDQYAQCMSQISSLIQENAENQATVRQAELEKQYAAGEVSEEEYYEKQEEIEKDAAKKKYNIQMWEWTAQVAQTTAQVAQAIASALAEGGPYAGPALAAMMGALGGVQLAAVIGAKPVPPSFATGGIVGGTSYYGDKVQANVNSGEMILNRRQQRTLFDMIGAGKGGSVQNNINVQNNASGLASVDVQHNGSDITILINKTVKASLEQNEYRRELMQSNMSSNGISYSS